MENQEQPTVLVTGATGAIGSAIARQIAAQQNYRVVLVARDTERAQQAVAEIVQATGNSAVRYELADLSRQVSIQALADRWQGPLHVLINNAAVTPPQRQETPEGIELAFATNVLGYFWMIQAFTPHLKHASPSRVVNVASYWAGELDLADLEFKRRPYHNHKAYRQSKQADRMLTVAFARRLEPCGISVNACHPGDVTSTLSQNLGFTNPQTPEEAARMPVWLATAPAGQRVTGKYFERRQPVECRFAKDKTALEALYQACLDY